MNEHWSTTVEWSPGRWDPMSNAPMLESAMQYVRVRTADGHILEPAHFAQDLSGDEQPAFSGWFVPNGPHAYVQVHPVEWQPLTANPSETP